MMRTITKQFGMSQMLVLILAGTALAGGTPSGTVVDNTATVDYQVDGMAQTTINSNTASFLVDNRVDVTVATLDVANIVVVPGMMSQVLSFSVTNNGNTVQDYALNALADASDDVDATNVNVFVDGNNNGTYEVGTDVVPYLDELAIDATQTVFIVGDIPLSVMDADIAGYHLLVQTSYGSGPNIQGSIIDADDADEADDAAAVQVVFADGAGSSDAANDGAHSSRSNYEVSSANLLVTKTHNVISDPINGTTRPKNIPGAQVGYNTSLTNNGGSDADNVVVIDPIPASTGFVVGSHAVLPGGTMEYSNDNGATWTYVPLDTGDGTDPNVTDMRILFPSIISSGTAQSTYQVVIQ